MALKRIIRKFVSDKHPLLLMYHKFKGMLAVLLYRSPSRHLKVIGVTGTNGKTTTVNLISDLLEQAGHKTGFTSTLRYKVAGDVWVNRAKMTTQSPFFIQKMLRRMVKEGCDYAIVEVTSHAMVQSRVWGINFDVGVFTNLTGDHIEYHGSFEKYREAKGKFIGSIFSMRRKKNIDKVLVLNGDDEHFDYYDQFKGDQKFIYGMGEVGVKAVDVNLGAAGTSFRVKVPNHEFDIKMNLLGEFNVYNALAAICVGISQGIGIEAIQAAFKKIQPIGGRLEPVNVGQDFAVVVDYAHTADSYASLCEMFKPLTKGRIIFVGGATGGGRDKLKRKEMGAVVDRLADIVVLTDDDPYFEDRWGIIKMLSEGVDRIEGSNDFYRVVDREEAIRLALTIASTGDTVLIAGKGGEVVYAIEDRLEPYDDRVVVRQILSEEIFSQVSL